jgi:hypothetical protein
MPCGVGNVGVNKSLSLREREKGEGRDLFD